MVDIPGYIKAQSDPKYFKLANEMEKDDRLMELMPKESFIHPISVKTYLRYIKYNTNIDFARYSKDDDNFEVLNNINIPIFMRWGNVYEMIIRDAINQVKFVNSKINNINKDINYIDGADHSYSGKEEILSEHIYTFLNKINN